MPQNAYEKLPETSYWSTGVRAPLEKGEAIDLPSLVSLVSKDDKVCSAGSCFAQYIGKELRKRGHKYKISAFSEGRVESFGIGNIYTSRQLKQWLEYGLDERQWSSDTICKDSGQFQDYLLPHHNPLPSVEAVEERRQQIASELIEELASAKLFVFTLGLTECWQNRAGDIFPSSPGTLIGAFDPEQHFFCNLGFQDVSHDLIAIEKLLTRINADLKLALTVSPVPLTATASGDHVLVATARSKAVLRAAAAEFVSKSAKRIYFPSYELITHNTNGDWRFKDNLRSVSEDGVAFVMGHAFGDASLIKAQASTRSGSDLPELKAQDETECEEQLLEAFNKSQNPSFSSSEIFVIGDSHCGKMSEAMTKLDVNHIGGMVMNGSGFTDNKFKLDDEKIFIPQETPESSELWNKIFDQLSARSDSKTIYTNIGFQTHRSIVGATNSVRALMVTKEICAGFFDNAFPMHLEVLKGLAKFGKVVLVEDPNFYPFIGGQSRGTTEVCNNYNFDIYCSHLRDVAAKHGFEYFKPSERILNEIFVETKGIQGAFAPDMFHGSELYYEKLAKMIRERHTGATNQSAAAA